MLQRGDLLPHFTVATVNGGSFSYATVWQQRNLVLVFVGAATDVALGYAGQIASHDRQFGAAETACVVTTATIDGLPSRGFVVADRWSEILHVASVGSTTMLPPPAELLEWAEFAQMRCPECEGEAR